MCIESKGFKHVLCKTNSGSVALSNCGCCFRIQYNNVLIYNDYQAFRKFYENLQDCYEAVNGDKDGDERSIFFGTRVENMMLSFSVLEIKELHYLFESALIEYEVSL